MHPRAHAVLFDLDNTLIDREAAATRWFQTRLGLDCARLVEARRRDARGHSPRRAFFRWLGDETLWDRFRQELPEFVQPFGGVHDLLNLLRRQGLRLGVLTNGGARLQRAKLRAAGLDAHFPASAVVVSQELGVDKPAPRAFHIACDRLGFDRETTLYVGDTPVADIHGSTMAGLRNCWVAGGRPWPADLRKPDFTVQTTAELAPLMTQELRSCGT